LCGGHPEASFVEYQEINLASRNMNGVVSHETLSIDVNLNLD
jgi:hypothetical protein